VPDIGNVIVYAPDAVLTNTTSPLTAVYACDFIKNVSDEAPSTSAFVAYI